MATRNKLYERWYGIKMRCYNKNHVGFKNYGGRGIVMCDEWKDDFSRFKSDMGEPPIGAWIERIDNEKSYSQNNCRWASPQEQSHNKSNNTRMTFYGITLTLGQWSAITGVGRCAIYMRIMRGWTERQAVFAQPKTRLAYIKRINVRSVTPEEAADVIEVKNAQARVRRSECQTGKKATKESRDKISASLRGHSVSKETREKLSLKAKQRNLDPDYRARIGKAIQRGKQKAKGELSSTSLQQS